MLALEAYIDDSGKGQPPVFVLAGFLGYAAQWAEFTEEWRAALAKKPALEYFKMREAASLHGQFFGWGEQQRDRRLAELLAIIDRRVISGVYSGVMHADFDKIIRGKIAKRMDNPYFLMYHGIIAAVLRFIVEHNIGEAVDFIFDEQFKQSDQVQEAYSAVVELAPPAIRPLLGARPIHRSEREFLPLQAADLHAWHVRRWFAERAQGADFTQLGMPALNRIPQIEDGWTASRLEKYLDRARRINRETGRVFPHEAARPKGPGASRGRSS
jgi:hypothetical protein